MSETQSLRGREQEKRLVIGWLVGGGGGLLLHHPPDGLSGDTSWSRAGGRAGVGVGVVGAGGFDLVNESFDGGELLGQVAQVSFEGVELFVEVV